MNSTQKWGKHVTIDTDNPEALGICDYTGFVFMRKDMVRQMEWRGNDLVWTGFYVGKPYADKPNEQNKTPILPPDPRPVIDPRPQFFSVIFWSTDNNIFSQDPYTFGSDVGLMMDVNVYPEPQRLKFLQNFHWGAQ
jgi:hypothetical protein